MEKEELLDIEKYKITHIIHTAGIYNSKNLIDYDIDLIESLFLRSRLTDSSRGRRV